MAATKKPGAKPRAPRRKKLEASSKGLGPLEVNEALADGKALGAFMARHERITMEVALVDLSSNPEEQSFDLAISGRTASRQFTRSVE